MIRLRTLGALDLRSSDGVELGAVLSQPRRLALLAHLAVTAPRGLRRRDALLGLFWPDQEEERARAALARSVYFLRRALGHGVLVSRRDEIGLDPTRFWCDASEFAVAIEAQRHREALELYRGDLLPGLFLSGGTAFHDWLEAERARCRAQASWAAWALAEAAAGERRLEPAARYARCAVDLAPFDEVGVRRLLSLLDRAGDRAGAVDAYRRFARELRAELDVAPSPETQALFVSIVNRAGSGTGRSEPAPPAEGPIPGDDTASSGPPTAALEPPRFTLRLSWRRWTMIAAAAAAALLAILAGSRSSSVVDPERVDVRLFENRTGDPAVGRLASATTERIVTGLRQTGLFRTVGPASPEPSGGGLLARGRLHFRWWPRARVHGVVTVGGALSRSDGTIRVDAWLADRRRPGRPWLVPAQVIASDDAERPTRELVARLNGGVAALQNAYTATFLPAAGAPPTLDAYRELVEGLALGARGQHTEARLHLRLAVAHDSTFTWPLIEAALDGLGGAAPSSALQADSTLEALTRLRSRMPVLERHLLDYLAAVRAEDWRASFASVCAAARLAPLRFAYRCAVAASQVNRPRATIAALTQDGELERLHRRDVQSYWLVLTRAYHQLGEYRNELAAARRARSNRPGSPSGLAQEVRALAALGRVAAIRALLDTVIAMGNEGWFTPGEAMLEAAQELRAHGQSEAAAEIATRAIAWDRARPAEELATEARQYELGLALYLHGDLSAADSVFAGLLADFPDNEEYLGLRGVIAARRGDRRGAEALGARIRALEHWIPLPGQTGIVWRAKIAALLGQPAVAVSLLRDAFGPDGTMELHADIDVEPIGSDPAFRDLVRPKG